MTKQIITFEGDLYLEDKKVWTNISNKAKTAKDREWYIKGMIKSDLIDAGQFRDNRDVQNAYNDLMMESHYGNNKCVEDIPTDRIQFKNAYLDLNDGKIKKDIATDTPFTPYQIPFNIYREVQDTWNPDTIALVDKFFKKISNGDEDFETGLLEVIGSTMAPRNDSIMPIFYSPHKSSGKGTVMEIISGINKKTREIKGEQWWGQSNQFSLAATRHQLTAWIDEVPSTLPQASTEKIKSAADSKRYMEIERKGIDQEKVLNTPTYIATTNNHVEFYSVDDSLKGRVMWFSFEMNQYGKMEFSKQEIDTITKDKDALEYIAYRAVKAYSEVLKRAGTRNEVFTRPKSHFDFWNGVKDLNKASEVIESSLTLTTLWDQKVDFIANDDLSDALRSFKNNHSDEKITLMGLQNELISYIHSNKLGVAQRSAKNNKRGIKITWASIDPDNELIKNFFGDLVTRKSLEESLERQAAETLAIKEEIEKENN